MWAASRVVEMAETWVESTDDVTVYWKAALMAAQTVHH